MQKHAIVMEPWLGFVQNQLFPPLQLYSTRTGSLLAREIPSFCIRK